MMSGCFRFYMAPSAYLVVAGKHRESRELADGALQSAIQKDNPIHLMMSHRMVGSNRFAQGELVDARRHLEKAWSLYEESRDAEAAAIYGDDYKTSYLAHLVPVLALLGYSDKATEVAVNEIARTKALGHAFALCHALNWFGNAFALMRMFDRIAQLSPELLDVSSKHGFGVWLAVGKIQNGLAQAHSGNLDDGIVLMEKGIEEFCRPGAKFFNPFFNGLLAQAVGKRGQWDYAGKLIDEAADVIETTEDRLCEAEIWRLKGHLAFQQHASAAAERSRSPFSSKHRRRTKPTGEALGTPLVGQLGTTSR